jgi:predicted DNA-binding transcriptional regulator AlpA
MIVSEKDAAQRIGLSARTLQRDRSEGGLGLPFVRLGLRRVGYDTDAIDRWLASRVRRSIAEERARDRNDA